MKVKLLKKIRKKYAYGYDRGLKRWWYFRRIFIHNNDLKTEEPNLHYYPFSWDIIFNMACSFVGEDRILRWRDTKVMRDLC